MKLPSNAPDEIKNIVQQIKNENLKNNFIPKLVKEIGYPNWGSYIGNNTSINKSSTNDSAFYFIPFQISENNAISAYLFCKQSADSFQLKLNTKNELKTKLNNSFFNERKRLIAKMSIIGTFEKLIFSKDSTLLDNCIIPKIKNSSIGIVGAMNNKISDFVDITLCVSAYEPYSGWVLGLAPNQDPNQGYWNYQCTSWTVWINVMGDEYLEENQNNNNYAWYESSGGGFSNGIPLDFPSIQWDANNIIIDSNLRPCMKQVLESIKQIKPGQIAKIINAFSGNSLPGFGWKIEEVGTLASIPDANATTTYNTNGNYAYTSLRLPSMPNATNLFHATVLIHEAVHAFLFSYFYNNTNLTQQFKDSMVIAPYSIQFENFIKAKEPQDATLQHELMFLYRNEIKAAVFDYCKLLNIGNNDTERDFIAEDMSWMGLQNCSFFNADPSQPSDESKQTMYSRWNAEKTNQEQYNSFAYPTTITVKGAKICN